MANLTKYEFICHPLYLIISGGLNFPPLVFGVLGFVEWCNYYSNWLVGNAALTGLNLIAAVYCVYKVRKVARLTPEPQNTEAENDDSEKAESDTDSNSHHETNEVPDAPPSPAPSGCFSRLIHLRTISSDRIRHLICYDGIITTYGILFLFWVFWLSEGAQRVLQADDVEEEEQFEGCLVYHERYMKTSLVCGFAYFGFVFAAGLASLFDRASTS
jgi:hypothetical protein